MAHNVLKAFQIMNLVKLKTGLSVLARCTNAGAFVQENYKVEMRKASELGFLRTEIEQL